MNSQADSFIPYSRFKQRRREKYWLLMGRWYLLIQAGLIWSQESRDLLAEIALLEDAA